MAGTAKVLLPLILSAIIETAISSSSMDANNTTKAKRQIFREQVNPQAGGRIPEDAFRSDRLALNRLNKEGIAVPDGVVLEARHRESHYGSHRHDPDIQASIVKVVLGEDGRYAPPEGRYPFNSLVESTYVLRPPINTPVIAVPPRRPHLATLRLPARPYFQQDHSAFNSIDQHIDFFNAFDPNFPGNGLWTGLLGPVPDVPNRLLRRQAKIPTDDVQKQNSNAASKETGTNADIRGRTAIDRTHYKSINDGRSLNIFQNSKRYNNGDNFRSVHDGYQSAQTSHSRTNDDYENKLVPVFLTHPNQPNYESQKGHNFVSYAPPESNFQHILPVVNIPLTSNPNFYYHPLQAVEHNTVVPADKTINSQPHYVLDQQEREVYNAPHHEKTLIPIHQQTSLKTEDDNLFHREISQVSSSLFEGQRPDSYKEIKSPNPQTHASLEDSFPNSGVSTIQNQHSHPGQGNVLVPVPVTHNQPNDFKQNAYQQPVTKTENSAEKQDVHYELINSFANLDTDYHNLKSTQSHDYNHLVRFNPDSSRNNDEIKGQYNFQNVRYPEPGTVIPKEKYETHSNNRPNQEGLLTSLSGHHQGERWQQPPRNTLKVISGGNEKYASPNRGIQYVRGGLHFEVVNDQFGVRQQSRGEVGQKGRNPNQNFENHRDGKTMDVGAKHLNQVLHYIEPHEVVHQISTSPSIEHEYPSLDTVPETSFICQGPGRAMIADPETSCQVFHLCNGDGSKESFLCPKGSRYDAKKQQCAMWTQVTCHA